MSKIPAGYKQTEAGVIPEGWQVSTVRAVSRKLNVGFVGTCEPFFTSESKGVVLIRTGNLSSGRFDWTETRYVTQDFHEKNKKSQVFAGDLLIARHGASGTATVVPQGSADANSLNIVIFHPEEAKLSPWYAVSLFNSDILQRQVKTATAGSTQGVINTSEIARLQLPLPPLPEQKRIAQVLGDVDALIQKLEALIAKKRDIKQAAMQELLTGKRRLPGFSGPWETKKLGEVGSTYGGLSGKSKQDFGTGNARYIPFLNIMNNVVIDKNQFDSVVIKANEAQNRALAGDLFFNGSSETPEEVGMCSLLHDSVDELYLNSFCFGFRRRPDCFVDGLFLAYYFRSNTGRELIKSLAQGATRYNISKMAFIRTLIHLPPLPEQTAIAQVLSNMDSELAQLETRLGKTRNLKAGLMQQLLTGKIRLTKQDGGTK
jgi:type I restriction enzyme S subunit